MNCYYEDARIRVKDIISQIPGFWSYAFEHPSREYLEDPYCDISEINSIESLMRNGEHPDNIQWAMGCSKIVIWDADFPDYVLKMALRDEDDHFCDREYENYCYAEEQEAEEAFAWMACIYSKHQLGTERSIYAMEYIECDEDIIGSNSYDYALSNYCRDRGIEEDEDSREEFYYYWSRNLDDNEMVMDFALNSWSMALRQKVEQIIFDRDINDLHSGNMGYRGDQLVLVDYSGWSQKGDWDVSQDDERNIL